MDPRFAFGRSPSGGHYSPLAPATPSSPGQGVYSSNPLFTTPPATPLQHQWSNSAPFPPSSPVQQQQKVTSVASLGLRPAGASCTPPVRHASVPSTPQFFSPPAGGMPLPFPPTGGVQLPFPPPQPLPQSPQPVIQQTPQPVMAPMAPPLPPGGPGGPPPPPPPPLSGMTGMPTWREQLKTKQQNPDEEALNNMPAALHGTLNSKNKKPFTYTPGGIDLSEIRSPRMHRRLLAHQQSMHDDTTNINNNSTVHQAEVHPPPLKAKPGPIEGQGGEARSPQNEPYTPTGSLPRNLRSPDEPFRQSQSFRLLQMMTDTTKPDQQFADGRNAPGRREEDEMRFSGFRQPSAIPSRAFNNLQQMTSPPPQPPNFYGGPENGNGPYGEEEGPVDIRYMGGSIPSRSFRILQEMTGTSDEDSAHNSPPPPPPMVAQKPRRVVRTQMNVVPNPSSSPAPIKQFPQPEVPASQQQVEADPRKYTGGRIPSQSFRILQAMTGQEEEDDGGTDF